MASGSEASTRRPSCWFPSMAGRRRTWSSRWSGARRPGPSMSMTTTQSCGCEAAAACSSTVAGRLCGSRSRTRSGPTSSSILPRSRGGSHRPLARARERTCRGARRRWPGARHRRHAGGGQELDARLAGARRHRSAVRRPARHRRPVHVHGSAVDRPPRGCGRTSRRRGGHRSDRRAPTLAAAARTRGRTTRPGGIRVPHLRRLRGTAFARCLRAAPAARATARNTTAADQDRRGARPRVTARVGDQPPSELGIAAGGRAAPARARLHHTDCRSVIVWVSGSADLHASRNCSTSTS